MEKDLLGSLLSFRDEKGQTLKHKQILDNIIGVLFAAQDTTATLLTWILKYMHDYSELLEAIQVWIYYILRASSMASIIFVFS